MPCSFSLAPKRLAVPLLLWVENSFSHRPGRCEPFDSHGPRKEFPWSAGFERPQLTGSTNQFLPGFCYCLDFLASPDSPVILRALYQVAQETVGCAFWVGMSSLRSGSPGQLQRFNWDAMLKDPHVAAGDFIDQGDMLVWTDPAELEFDIIGI